MNNSDNTTVAFNFESGTEEESYRITRKQADHYIISMKKFGRSNDDLRLEIIVHSIAQEEKYITLDIEWDTELEAIHHDYLFSKAETETDWKVASSSRCDTLTRTIFMIKPGNTEIGTSPSYKIGTHIEFLIGIKPHPLVMEKVAGYSAGKRSVDHVVISNKTDTLRSKENCLVIARAHPSETAGSYCIEGMINFLLSSTDVAELFLDRYDFHFLPLLNIDGVTCGNERFPGSLKTDLNRDFDCNRLLGNGAENDPVLKLQFALIDKLKPALYLNLHNWCSKFEDGLIGWDKDEVELFLSFMPDQTDDFKNWRVICNAVPGARSPGRYSRETWGTLGFNLEFPWYGRSIEKMRKAGESALKALVHTGIKQKQKEELKNGKN